MADSPVAEAPGAPADAVTRADIGAAVSAGHLTEAQAASLLAFADRRRTATLTADDEPFELFRGLNDVFIAVGMGVFVFAIMAAARHPLHSAVLLLPLCWCGAEYFTRIRRMVLPSMLLAVVFLGSVLVVAFVLFSPMIAPLLGDGRTLRLTVSPMAAAPPAITAVAGLAFYWRFRLPFSVFLTGLAVGLAALALAGAVDPSTALALATAGPVALFDLAGGTALPFLTLGLGLLAFVAAMSFDLSDPYRISRRAACGFWLHVLAAPALMNTPAQTLLGYESAAATGALMVVIVLFALVAVVIDRRSFLLASTAYLVTLAFGLTDEGSVALILMALGLGIVALGAGWTGLRGRLMRALPAFPGKDRLPPYRMEQA